MSPLKLPLSLFRFDWKIVPLLLASMAVIGPATAGVPAGGALITNGLGIGSGTATPFITIPSAPASSVKVTSSTGWIDLPNVTLRSDGDWAVFLVTLTTGSDHEPGTVFSIGAPSNTLFKDSSHLSLTWCGRYTTPWSAPYFIKSFVVTARDDAGIDASDRDLGTAKFYGLTYVRPLVGFSGMGDGNAHGIVIQRRAGKVEFWTVDRTGPRLMDYGAEKNFGGITNKAFRLGAALLATQPVAPAVTSYFKKPIQGVVVYNGGALDEFQMQRLYNGADAEVLLGLQASRGDRYYPGTLIGGQLEEVVDGKHGTFTGTVVASAGILPAGVVDDVIVDMDGGGQVLPKDPPPATTSKARFWGRRIGATADIRMRIVKWNAPSPAASGDIIRDWQTVASNVQNNQTWIGDITGVPHGFANYDCEISWRLGSTGAWSAGKRLNRQWSLGVSMGMAGQSILQEMRTAGGTARSFNPTVAGFIRGYYNVTHGPGPVMDRTQSQGWLHRPLPPMAPTAATNAQWGENRMSERLALLTGSPVGVANPAVGASAIGWWTTETSERWGRWKRFIQRHRPQIGIWGNGQGDIGMSRAVRWQELDTLLEQYHNAVQTAPGGPWNYMFYVFPLNGNWGGNDPDAMRSHDIEWVKSRAALGKPVGLLCTVLDGTTKDNIHLTHDDAGHGRLATRMAQTVAYAVGAPSAPQSGNGPEIDRAASYWTTSGGVTTITLPVILNGGTGLTTAGGGAPSGFRIKIDDVAASAPPATAQILTSPLRIVLTTPGTAVNSVWVSYLHGQPGAPGGGMAGAGLENAVYDNRTDVTGLMAGNKIFPMPPITWSDPLIIPAGTPAPTEVIVDNTAATMIIGAWTSSTYSGGGAFYGADYIYTNTGGNKSVRFTPTLTAGTYQVYARHTMDPNRATNVPVAITHAGGTSNVTVNQETGGGQWILLGTYTFNAGTGGSVLVSNTGANGYVVVDAVRFLKL